MLCYSPRPPRCARFYRPLSAGVHRRTHANYRAWAWAWPWAWAWAGSQNVPDGTLLGRCWDAAGTLLGRCWDAAGTLLGHCWDAAGRLWDALGDPGNENDGFSVVLQAFLETNKTRSFEKKDPLGFHTQRTLRTQHAEAVH